MKKHKKYDYNKNLNEVEFDIGDNVLLKSEITDDLNISKKLQLYWQRPYKVVHMKEHIL